MALLALWSPKGGAGVSVLTAACALVLARRRGGARVVDLDGDQAAIFGIGTEPSAGAHDWLAAGADAPSEAIERLALDVAPGVALVPCGSSPPTLAPHAAAEAGAALAVALRDGPPTLVDAGGARTPAARALVEVADASLVVVRGCYLTLRRAVRSPLLGRAAGLVFVDEPGRSLGPREVADVLGRAVVARVPIRDVIGRAVDAGTLPARLPEALARPALAALASVGLVRLDRGRAA